ncbi:FAD-dependent monooxygenase [Saccharopolyspora mangrovi]|uniref:FAD-dependent oxidoreductase n=1 Tax=Saccharopolyspora mangrovi TaxID=3082379 RepID=A0ABU6AHE1_9PSEU|nr:FAD-dependent monooxygenase [Saccharopolyspora sp. S2-29]MEB3370926.1 FAD-dependent oxidoreductase [Saccharopolyspora sp. S2-29]
MTASQSFEIVVVGAGLGGLCAALSLRQRGLRVTVVEAAPELGEIGAGIQTAPNASRILIGLGLRTQLEQVRTQPEDQVRRRWADGSIIAQLPLGQRVINSYGAPYWHYHRADLHRVLLDACLAEDGHGPVVRVETSARVVELDRTEPRRPAVVTADGRRFGGDLVIGADGIRSAVRDLAGFDDTLVFSGEMAYRALIPGDLVASDPATRFLLDRYHSTIWYGPDKHLVHYVIRGGEYLNVVAIVPSTEQIARDWSGPATAEQLAAEYADWDERVPAVLAKAKDEDVSLWAMYRRRRDPVWIDGRVALLGDACHAMLPYQAQGASQAMEDGAVLAEELGRVTRDDIDGALIRYVDRRAKHAGMVQDASLQNMDFYHLPDGPEQRDRDAKLRRFDGESDVSYDWLWNGSPLNDPDTESIHYQFAR